MARSLSIRFLAAVALTLVLAGPSYGDQVVYQAGFEQPNYISGALIGQDG